MVPGYIGTLPAGTDLSPYMTAMPMPFDGASEEDVIGYRDVTNGIYNPDVDAEELAQYSAIAQVHGDQISPMYAAGVPGSAGGEDLLENRLIGLVPGTVP